MLPHSENNNLLRGSDLSTRNIDHFTRPPNRKISEVIALLPENSPAVMVADFARDIEEAIVPTQITTVGMRLILLITAERQGESVRRMFISLSVVWAAAQTK